MSLLAEQFIGSDASKLVIVSATVISVFGLVLMFAVIFGRREATVERRLAGYEPAQQSVAATAGGGVGVMAPAETGIVQQGIGIATRVGERTGWLTRLERLLDQAEMPLRAGELLFYLPVFAILAFLGLAILFGPIAGIIAGVLVVVIPLAVIQRRAKQRVDRFEAMLPPTLTLLASSMRAGFSLMQGLETVAQETAEPVRRELQRVFTEVRLGQSIEDALGQVADRMGSQDLAWTVMAIRIQREVGGNLAALLDTVAETMTQRERLRREVKTLTAEGRFSAVILSLFPPVMAVAVWLIRPAYIETLFEHAVGIVAVIAAVILNFVGWLWLSRIVDIEA